VWKKMIGIRLSALVTIGLTILVCVGCGDQTDTDSKHIESVRVSKDANQRKDPPRDATFVLTEQELQRLKPLALRGDSDAAERLHYHYAFTDDSPAGQVISAKWKLYAAENGNANMMQELAYELSSTGSAEDCERGQFWLDRLRKLTPQRDLPEKITCAVVIQ
jgi:hypothetical protein